EIRSDSSKNNYTILAAVKNKNKNLNRYRDVSPYDHSRIVLSKGKFDYINASLVKVEKAHRQYILAQGPLRHTTGHFWLMVWEQNCKAVVMVTKIIEKNQEKCHQYWPIGEKHGGEDVMVLNDVGLKVKFISEKVSSDFTARILRLTEVESGKKRDIVHFHYTTWPDFGVPESPTAFLRFLAVVRRSGALSEHVGPPVVHCSAGIGRSGTFCLVDSCLVLMNDNGVNSVKVKDLLMEMRCYRMGLIQTPDQLRFSYLAIIEGITKKDWDTLSSDEDDDMVEDEDDEEAEDEDESEGAPPLPPPRAESLMSNKPLPSEPNSDPLECICSLSLYRGEGLRERKRAESRQKIAEQVAEMKRKQEKAETYSRIKRSLLSPLSLGFGAFLLGSSIIYILLVK
ncbi:hypothetical protein AAG570_012078, partial [Ranatra chinensis]